MQPVLDAVHAVIGREDGEILFWQMLIRAAVIFAVGVLLVRLAGKRVFGQWSPIDIVLSVIVGSNLSRCLTGSAPFFETIAATALLVLLHRLLTSAAVRFSWLGPLLKGNTVTLIANGEIDEKAMRRHNVGPHDLDQALRCAGVASAEHVAEARLERSGEISVVQR